MADFSRFNKQAPDGAREKQIVIREALVGLPDRERARIINEALRQLGSTMRYREEEV